jgi:hypothetical protein
MACGRDGAVAITFFRLSCPLGSGWTRVVSRGGFWARVSSSRRKALRADRKDFQVITIMSTGWVTRPSSTLAAIIAPGLSSPRITSTAPAARARDCCV